MAFRRVLPLVAGQAALFGGGLLAVLAWRSGFFATVGVISIASLAIAAMTIAKALDRPSTPLVEPFEVASTSINGGKWRAVVDHTPAPLVALHADGGLRAINRAARALFGADDRVPSPPADLIAGLTHAAPQAMGGLILPTPGGPRAFALQVSEMIDGGGITRLGALVDIQAQIHAAEARSLRDLLAVLSHEVMNSLTPVASLAETAGDYLADETSSAAQAARSALSVVARRASGLGRFVEGYRSLARVPPPTLKPTRIADLLQDISQMFRSGATGAGVELTLAITPADLTADLDPDLINQALLNLLTNAGEAMGDAGRITLSAAKPAGRLEIVVEDSGLGVADDLRASIFQPFVTTKSSGTGIGLSLARQIALSHGGDLTLLKSIPGRGARFRLAF